MLIFLLSAILFCQNTFNDSKEALVEEKILLQTDRDFYITGETLWFRADYLVNNKKADRN